MTNLTITAGMKVSDVQAKYGTLIGTLVNTYDENKNGIFEQAEADRANKAIKEAAEKLRLFIGK